MGGLRCECPCSLTSAAGKSAWMPGEWHVRGCSPLFVSGSLKREELVDQFLHRDTHSDDFEIVSLGNLER